MTASNRRDFLRLSGTAGAALALEPSSLFAHMKPSSPPNILLLYVDDFRPLIQCYGADWMHTPNLDRMAQKGLLFENAYSQFPICGPSRASLITGLRPTPDRFTKWNARIDQDSPDTLVLPEHFRRNGYATQCIGKVIHDIDDCESAWSEGTWIPEGILGMGPRAYALPENQEAVKHRDAPPFESAPVDDLAYGDGQTAQAACQALEQLAQKKQPFFLATGFLRPHLPFSAPEKYWKLYDPDTLPVADNPQPPQDVPAGAVSNWEELRKYGGMPNKGPVTAEQARTLVHGYCASISYLDAQIGKVLNQLAELKLEDNTHVILVTDHGWLLGEHGAWSKHCLFEEALHGPLILQGPGIPADARAAGLAEYLDVYPTLCDLAGLPQPDHLQGHSLMPQIKNPKHPGSEAVFSRIGRWESVKTPTHRYSESRNDSGHLIGRMLYDHRKDPGENINISEQPSERELLHALSERLAQLRLEYTNTS